MQIRFIRRPMFSPWRAGIPMRLLAGNGDSFAVFGRKWDQTLIADRNPA